MRAVHVFPGDWTCDTLYCWGRIWARPNGGVLITRTAYEAGVELSRMMSGRTA